MSLSMRFLFLFLLFAAANVGAGEKSPGRKPVQVIGTASDYFYTRNWNSYYWREDFSFLLKDEKTGKSWRIISREPTPAYNWRFGTTFAGRKVDWQAKPRVKVVGVAGVDRQPAEFYHFKLDDANLATALVLYVEGKSDAWQEVYVNNWFHKWGAEADKFVHQLYAGKQAPSDIFGFINGQAAPFNSAGKAAIAKHSRARMFHGLIRPTKENAFGYEIELLHLFGPDNQGNGVVFVGDPKTVPALDMKSPRK